MAVGNKWSLTWQQRNKKKILSCIKLWSRGLALELSWKLIKDGDDDQMFTFVGTRERPANKRMQPKGIRDDHAAKITTSIPPRK